MGCKRTGMLLVTLVSLIPLSLGAPPLHTPPQGILPILDTPNLREFAVQELETSSLERFYNLQEESARAAVFASAADVASAADIAALIISVVGWLANASLEATIHPLETTVTSFATVMQFLAFLYRTGIGKEIAIALFIMCIDPNSVTLTARIQDSFANSRRADCAIKEPITEETKRNLLTESERYFRFSTAAYGIPQIWASGVLKSHVDDRAIVNEIVANKIAEYLGISRDEILHLTPQVGPPSMVHHFVAVDQNTSSVVLALRGTYSVSELCADAKASTGTYKSWHMIGTTRLCLTCLP